MPAVSRCEVAAYVLCFPGLVWPVAGDAEGTLIIMPATESQTNPTRHVVQSAFDGERRVVISGATKRIEAVQLVVDFIEVSRRAS